MKTIMDDQTIFIHQHANLMIDFCRGHGVRFYGLAFYNDKTVPLLEKILAQHNAKRHIDPDYLKCCVIFETEEDKLAFILKYG